MVDDSRSIFGTLPGGGQVDMYTLTNAHKLEVRLISYGAIITSLRTPDRDGRMDDIVLGFDTLDGYLTRSRYFGAVVGRCANRIADAQFTLDGTSYLLTANNGRHHLHGGRAGFDKVLWTGVPFRRGEETGVAFHYISGDGEEGYPGTLDASVTYTLTPRNELIVDYAATADHPTPINLTQHSYFNLSGEGHGDILRHHLTIDADQYTPTDDTQIPTGEIRPVAGTPFDFRQPTEIGARIDSDDEQIRRGNGYDHNFVLRSGGDGAWLHHAARLEDPVSGRSLDVATTEPGLQFYSGNKLDGSAVGKHGHVYGRRCAVCLETQHFPDSSNHANFPSTILRPGHHYKSRTVFAFTAPSSMAATG